MESLRFKGTVDEIDVGKISSGMEAEIQIGALPDTKIPGRVDRIFPKAKKEGNATLFDIEISFGKDAAGSDPAGRIFGHGEHPDPRPRKQVVLLPERLVLFEDGKKFRRGPRRAGGGRRRRSKSGQAFPTD